MTRDVLLIEDNAAFRRSVLALFTGEVYRFIEAGTPEQGIEVLKARPDIRVILLDLRFTRGSDTPGTAVLEHIKEHSDEYRVIVLTGHDELLLAEQAGESAVFFYLPKTAGSSSQAIRFSVEQAFKDLERVDLQRKLCFLLDVQERITAGREPTETLDKICTAVRSTVGAYTCHIRVYDFSGGDYHLRGFAGAHENMRGVFARPKAKGDIFSGRVVKSRQPEVLEDLQGVEEFRRFAAEALARPQVSAEEKLYWQTVRSAYLVPISTGLFGEAVDAVLNVSSKVPGFFTTERCALVKEFVTQAALTITKDWLLRKREGIHSDYSEISGMLSDISDQLTHAQALAEIYDVVTRRISAIVAPEVVSIFLYNDATKLIENVAELKGSEPVAAPDEFYRPGESLTGAVFQNDRIIQLPEPGDAEPVKPLEDPRYDHSHKPEYLGNIPSGKLDHYLGVPIRIGGEVRGVLRAMNKKSHYYQAAEARHNRLCLLERGFSRDCRNVLEITASHLAVAIHNAELLQEKDRQVKQIQSLGEVGRLINSSLEFDKLLELTIQKMAEVMQAEICMLFLKEGDDRIVLRECYGMPMLEGASYRFGEGLTGRVAETKKPCLIETTDANDGKYDPLIREFLTAKHGKPMHIESLMVVPVIAKTTTLGAMKVINKVGDHHQYRRSDLEFFLTFAAYVGVAIENAQSYKVTSDRLAIAERNAALSYLVAAVCHEIRNTSGVIPANVAGIKAQLGSPDEEILGMLDLIGDAASQATEFADELDNFFPRDTERQAMDLSNVIRSALEALRYELERYENSKNIGLEITVAERPLVCAIYRAPFIRIIRNIVINAYQALERKRDGMVRLSTEEGAGEATGTAVIRIEDNGPGIKKENLPRIFDPLFSTKPKGNGIGLWLVRTQLEAIGGKIEVESEVGRGASFIIRIPLSTRKGGPLDESNAGAAG